MCVCIANGASGSHSSRYDGVPALALLCCSCNTRVSNELGAGNAAAAKLACFTSVALVVIIEGCIALTCWFAGRQIIQLLTNSDAVIQLTMDLLPILLPTFVSEFLSPAHGSVAMLQPLCTSPP
jgi:hypothetical protein